MNTKTNYNKKVKKIKRNSFINGVAHVKCSFNNTIISISDPNGNVFASCSGGGAGFSNSKESTPHAAKIATEKVADKAIASGLKFLLLHLKGPGPGKDSVVTTLKSKGFEITAIKETTGVAYNGCKPRKRRRV